MILLIGSEGSMGKRYQAILRFLGRDYLTADKFDTEDDLLAKSRVAHGYIVCTPTETHFDHVMRLLPFGRPIMCEKPVSRNKEQLDMMLEVARENETPFQMVYQYKRLVKDEPKVTGWSYYNYFRHGSDGLAWDCLQVIGLAKGEIRLEETSPIWTCRINGQQLSLGDMDRAYVEWVQQWFSQPQGDLGEIRAVHQKVRFVEEASKNG